ncbi:MAG TPA: CPBP family glutamic-type intramembrane protease [Thermoleophilaceae bacterium]
MRPPPDPPELPEAARPRWPAWYAPVALVAAFGAVSVLVAPFLPVLLISGLSDTAAAVALLILLLVQDSVLVGTALLFALGGRRLLRPWHFGIRATRLWPTVGWAALAIALMLGFELAWIALLGVDEGNVDDLEHTGAVAETAVALAVIVVAPVTEEFFFRAFFYRALRTRLAVWSGALIDGLIFGALHFDGVDSLPVLPVIAVFGVGQCLVYERTGSLFAVIAIHACFNTFATVGVAPVPALVVGALVVLGCLLLPRLAGRRPSPVAA